MKKTKKKKVASKRPDIRLTVGFTISGKEIMRSIEFTSKRANRYL